MDNQNLIWLDLEMTGLNPDTDLIIEIATIITDKDLNILAEGPVFALHQSDTVLAAMDDWNQKHHGQSGLIERVKASTITEQQAEQLTLDFLKQWLPERTSPLCGNSIGQDRRFLARYMPNLEAFFHYRNLDVSTLKELVARWAPELKKGFTKESKHQALDDIIDSIEELRYYRKHFIVASNNK
ncbi:oligoribonuclease [Methylocucumis oryzae]|uniref:Oligoribonuclease n=1 Tax=Methylocucumis oryzae TaxID=1632867 RepID=A0A0F3IG10_9GAMM|nr:oligoribonuclease [Methylocucumis oryzae]KJV05735.1 oligoribonuclease [Methylocucumis oryzae]